MKTIDIALTVDHEAFGDGSGDAYRDQIKPSNESLLLLKNMEKRTTFFVEMGSFFTMPLRISGIFGRFAGYRRNLSDLVKRGQELQLHLHPVWPNATHSNGWFN